MSTNESAGSRLYKKHQNSPVWCTNSNVLVVRELRHLVRIPLKADSAPLPGPDELSTRPWRPRIDLIRSSPLSPSCLL